MSDPLSLWNKTPIRQAILDFVAAVTTPGSRTLSRRPSALTPSIIMASCGEKSRLTSSYSSASSV
jgi:hypothetical protein